MALSKGLRASVAENPNIRRWVSRAFIVSILVYFVVIGYLVAESVMGASRWAPYGVNIAVFIALIVVSEIIVTATAVWIFKEDAGIWPDDVGQGWSMMKHGPRLRGLGKLLSGAWDISVVDLRLRSPGAILAGRVNRIAAIVPLAYALVASSGGAPWGLRGSALFDIAISLAVWGFMEAVMVQPQATTSAGVRTATREVRKSVAPPPSGRKESSYYVRPVVEADVQRVAEIERIKWKEQAATPEMIRSRLRIFPEGQLAAIHVTSIGGVAVRETLVAWSTIARAAEAEVRAFGTWDAVTADGTINSHDRKGDVIVGVNLTSVTEGATYLLLGEILASVVEWGKIKLIGGGRLNGFVTFNERRKSDGNEPFTADQYARLREIRGYRFNERRIENGERPLSDRRYISFVKALRAEREDPPLPEDERPDYVCSNLRGYLSIPGARLIGVMPGYFDDPASENYGAVIEWPNPVPRALMHTAWVTRLVARRIRREIRAEWETRRQRMRRLSERRRTAQFVPEFLRRESGSEQAPMDAGVPAVSDAATVSAADVTQTGAPTAPER